MPDATFDPLTLLLAASKAVILFASLILCGLAGEGLVAWARRGKRNA